MESLVLWNLNVLDLPCSLLVHLPLISPSTTYLPQIIVPLPCTSLFAFKLLNLVFH